MSEGSKNAKLSLLAMYDDMCRFSNSLIGPNNGKYSTLLVSESINFLLLFPTEILISLLQNYEDNRKKWASTQLELFNKDAIVQKLESENHELKNRLQAIRMAFAREVKAKEALMKKYNDLRSKLSMVHELLNEENNANNLNTITRYGNSKSKLLSVFDNLDLSVRKSLNAYESENDSNDELLFDKSDDQLEEQCAQPKIRRLSDQNHIYAVPMKVTQNEEQVKTPPKPPRNCSTITEEDEEQSSNSVHNTGFITNPKELAAKEALSSSPTSTNSAGTGTGTVSTLASSKTGSTLSRQHSNRCAKETWMRSKCCLQPELLDTRGHNFQQKKAFRPVNCIPCGKSIGFCSSCVVCADCRGVAHLKCQDQLPKPCIPYHSTLKKMVSVSGNGMFSSQGNMVMIGDFTQIHIRPCVPALLVHCCNEIKRRIDSALNDGEILLNPKANSPLVGIYRACGSDKSIRELRIRILEAKNGIPNLSLINDVHVICGVVKLFLRDLDDPLITRILWQDFARAAGKIASIICINFKLIFFPFLEHVLQCAKSGEHTHLPDSGCDEADSSSDECSESLQVLKDVILQLPNANRDSLAFLFLHFRHVIDSNKVTFMDAENLSKMLGPTLVGSSVPCSSSVNETVTQITVMRALFLISRQFWSGLLKDANFSPFDSLFNLIFLYFFLNEFFLDKHDVERKSSASNLKTKIKKVSSSSLRDLVEDAKKPQLNITKYKSTTIDMRNGHKKEYAMINHRQRSSIDLNALY